MTPIVAVAPRRRRADVSAFTAYGGDRSTFSASSSTLAEQHPGYSGWVGTTAYVSWRAPMRRTLEPVGTTGKILPSHFMGIAETTTEVTLESSTPLFRWSDLALAAFPEPRAMTPTEAAAYKAFKRTVFRRR